MALPKQALSVELFQRIFHHWKSTVAGIGLGLLGLCVDIAHGMGDQLVTFVDPTSLSWPDLRNRLVKSLVLSTVMALGRFNWHPDPTQARRRSDDPVPEPPKADEK